MAKDKNLNTAPVVVEAAPVETPVVVETETPVVVEAAPVETPVVVETETPVVVEAAPVETPVVVETAPVETPVVIETETPAVVEAAPVENNAKPLGEEVSKELIEKMQPYIEAYPANKNFYITSDGQVFLEGNKADAAAHEKTLGGTVEEFGN